jgi:hypothetical protein
LYKLDKFGYPDSKQGLEVLVGPYLNTLPKDPWGKQRPDQLFFFYHPSLPILFSVIL